LANGPWAERCSSIISVFDGTDHDFLSNFYPSKCKYQSMEFVTVEHGYQALKAIPGSMSDDGKTWFEGIRDSETASQSKKLGRKCPLRADWESIKNFVMMDLVLSKFTINKDLAEKLIATADSYLIEGTRWHDNCWGICVINNCSRCQSSQGMNQMGNTLMIVRDIIIEGM
jgi:ribA/ribD-fused uncharacterized protein